jgi:predicted MFS family arabinose efflux permease
MAHRADPDPPEGLGRLYAAPFVSYLDRFALPPVLLTIAVDLGTTLKASALVATVYFLLYGLMQPFYGLLSDRVGRIRVLRWALVGMAVGGVLAAVAPTLGTLLAAKALTGACAGALLPTSLVYVGDRVPFDVRQQVVANIQAVGAAGTVLGTLGAGLLGRYGSWRLVFLVPAVLALALAAGLGRLPDPPSDHPALGSVARLGHVLRQRWVRPVLVLAFVEGAVILGFLAFLVPALEAGGESTVVAALVVSVYGVATLVGTQLVKAVLRRSRRSPAQLIGIGAASLLAAYLSAAASQERPGILAASVLIGLAFAFLHSTLQTWATNLVPDARGTATSLFVTAVFTGAAVATAAVRGLAGDGRYALLFLVAAALTVPVALAAPVARARYGRWVKTSEAAG